jgi:WD40 repeat protein
MLHLQALVNDGSAFVQYFGMVIAESAPHIYLSALPFAPSSSLIAANYSQMFPCTLSVKVGKVSHWPMLEITISVGEEVHSAAFSPDGQHIVSGSYDNIYVWNATTGERVIGPISKLRLCYTC